MKKGRQLILSCEHAGNRVPKAYQSLFVNHPDVLKTHRGYDIGVAAVAAQLQKQLGCPLCVHEWTRLLVDVNRTHRASLFSEFSKPLNDAEKQRLIDAYYTPYHEQLCEVVSNRMQRGPVLHLSLHSFTPELRGQRRNADIGIMYDPARSKETAYALTLQARLREISGLRIRRNYPYLGRSDGMTRRLRRLYSQTQYLGFEIEFNQAMLTSLNPKERQKLISMLADNI